MIPGEIIPADGTITLNEGRETVTLTVANTGDRPFRSAAITISSRPIRPAKAVARMLPTGALRPGQREVRLALALDIASAISGGAVRAGAAR